ncbi:indolepyruvate ferredoxin oxidoreductase family protein [Streptomyces ochraceiscleroticus]|uniref:Indolepyruvate ferredoxin oxidoreductase family protein n=1 Tax=Streptomyces ochraceiscleroticus TaxID=47761 RepID=A0ABW1MLS8_9ACTN|nr:indolepyruvate ferredoxin oxidoreductase family protein [Streptomyces ochraceiscleroticus]
MTDGGPGPASTTLDARYSGYGELVHLTGIQALVRVIVERRRTDVGAGLDTAGFVSGYPGSPLGGLDTELEKQRDMLRELGVVHQPGVNEELGATTVLGSQLVEGRPGARVEGVTGWWYGKAPGLDRAADAIRHGNAAGTGPRSGAVVLVGDDPSSKSSTLPSASELTLRDLGLPILYPGTIADVLELGHHAVELSRLSGLWVGMKIVTDVADGSASVVVEPAAAPVSDAGPSFTHKVDARVLPPVTTAAEERTTTVQLDVARRYGEVNGLNRVTLWGPADRLGIVAAGKTYADLRHGLREAGIDDEELQRAGIRLYELRMPWPLSRDAIREFAAGLDEVLVVEEKRPFIELEVARALVGLPDAPALVGKTDGSGKPVVPEYGTLGPGRLADIVVSRAAGRLPTAHRNGASQVGRPLGLSPLPSRQPYFCSGCPHNRSAQVPAGTAVGGGIGCHLMVVGMDERFGEFTGMTQMGGEGAQWAGMAPFLAPTAFVQNIGDGTFFHSGQLALRQVVAAGVTMTYKILYNTAIAMTGGQSPQGAMSVPDLTKLLQLEGVVRTIVTTEEPARYKGVRLAANATVWRRDRLEEAQRVLANVSGVTALVHDQECALQKRRFRKRSSESKTKQLVVINERVCEGCGDCSRASNCLSLHPVDTEFGQKTQVHQSSCNVDYSCLDGNCPSFVTITRSANAGKRASRRPDRLDPPLCDEPERVSVPDGGLVRIRMAGVGGTGVVTVNQVLATAGLLDGYRCSALDQTGTAQKGGPVVSDLLVAHQTPSGNRVSESGCDVLLALDSLVAMSGPAVETVLPGLTSVVLNTDVAPTGEMVGHTEGALARLDEASREAEQFFGAERTVTIAANTVAEHLVGNHVLANVVVLGAAYQRGLLPMSSEAILEVFTMNGTAVAANHAAFGWGRAAVAHPHRLRAALDARVPARSWPSSGRPEADSLAGLDMPAGVADLVRSRAEDLVRFQNRALAEDYVRVVAQVAAIEAERVPGSTRLATAVAENLHKLTAYKDEYEVARLHLEELQRVLDSAGGEVKTFHWNLHPPVLKALGMSRKIRLGPWFRHVFRALYAARVLRGTRLDPFGRDRIRRLERQLLAEYRTVIESLGTVLSPTNADLCVEVAGLPALVRGYDEVKLANIETYRAELGRCLANLGLTDLLPAAPSGSGFSGKEQAL